MTIAPPYQNYGNELVLSLVPTVAKRILDVGCGAGDNGRRLREIRRDIDVFGITHSVEEAAMAAPFLSGVEVLDVEFDSLLPLGTGFDVIIFSHVLEHLRDPVAVLRRFLPLLTEQGFVVIAVPNTLEWRTRFAFLRGRFQYGDRGILDRTHLRFFTYATAVAELIEPVRELELLQSRGRGSAPLGPFRNRFLARPLRALIDDLAVRKFPNLFAREIALVAKRRGQ
ncbi:class I SAM-dependent methyltransferase [Mesorhizobium sp. M1273]|uniref:class I SAM-dependent methyltransferase n=1 Tax=Mesorhizobium sp. M1273 TaxID=2957075 RepID=UPI00333BB087